MNPQELRRPAVLAAVVVLLGAAWWWTRPPAPVAPVATGRPATVRKAAAPAKGTVEDVRLERLDAAPVDMAPPDRNLFRFRARAAAPASPGSAPRRVPVMLGPPVPPGPPGPVAPPPPPPIQLKFVGLVDAPTAAARVAVLADPRGNVFHGREGDIIDGRYRVLRIGVESADLAYVDGRGRQTLRLSGQ